MNNERPAIAECTLRFACADGRGEHIRVTVHEPRSENIDWSCSFAVTGFSREVRRCVCGADAMQALVLAIHILPTEVRDFVENEPGAFIDEPDLGIDRACRMNLDPDTAVNEFVAYYVRQLSGPGREDAWHRLAEAGRGVIPSLIRAVKCETDPHVQTGLIQILAECRSPEAISVLADLVLSADADVWKTALDALVTIGGDESCTRLEEARLVTSVDRQSWIDEAIEQIRDARRKPE